MTGTAKATAAHFRGGSGAVASDAEPPVWGMREIAAFFGMTPGTVHDLRAQSIKAHKEADDAGEAVPVSFLPLPDWIVSSMPVWKPSRIRSWGKATGRIDENGNPRKAPRGRRPGAGRR